MLVRTEQTVVMKVGNDLLVDEFFNNFANRRNVSDRPEMSCLGGVASLMKRDDDGTLPAGRHTLRYYASVNDTKKQGTDIMKRKF